MDSAASLGKVGKSGAEYCACPIVLKPSEPFRFENSDYNYFRTYDPRTGRYLESDPIGIEGGLNTYGYALQNPLRYTDPTGENPLTLPAAGTLARGCLRNGICAGTVGAATGVALGCALNPSLCNSIVTAACRDASDAIDDLLKPFLNEDKKLTPGEWSLLLDSGSPRSKE